MKRKNETTVDLQQLQRIGFTLHELEDSEYGSQPDAGSRAAGIAGRDEYGIRDTLDADEEVDADLSVESINDGDTELENDGLLPNGAPGENSAGVSQYSATHSNTDLAKKLGDLPEPEEHFSYALQLLKKRIANAPTLKDEGIIVSSRDNKIIELRGTVRSVSNRETARELAESIAIGIEIDDALSVGNG